MMAYTTDTAAARFSQARRPKYLRPFGRSEGFSAAALEQALERQRQTRRAAALPVAAR